MLLSNFPAHRDYKKLSKALTTDNRLLKPQFKSAIFQDEFFSTQTITKSNNTQKLNRKVQYYSRDKSDQNIPYVPQQTVNQFNFQLNIPQEYRNRPDTNIQLRNLSTQRSSRFRNNLPNSFYKSLTRRTYSKMTMSSVQPEVSETRTYRTQNVVEPDQQILFHDDNLIEHLQLLQSNKQMEDIKFHVKKDKKLTTQTEQSEQNLNSSSETIKCVKKKTRWFSKEVERIDRDFRYLIKQKQEIWEQEYQEGDKSLKEKIGDDLNQGNQRRVSKLQQDQNQKRNSKSKSRRDLKERKSAQQQFIYNYQCLLSENIYKNKQTLMSIIREYMKHLTPQEIKKYESGMDIIDADLLFKELVANIQLLQKLKQSQKAVVQILSKIPGFNNQIKYSILRQKIGRPYAIESEDKAEYTLKENLSQTLLIVNFVFGIEGGIQYQQQIDTICELITQGSGILELINIATSRQKSYDRVKFSLKNQSYKLLELTQNNDLFLSYVKDLKLDLEFIKKLYYYNKNLEEFLDGKLKENAKQKNEEITAVVNNVQQGVHKYLFGNGSIQTYCLPAIKKLRAQEVLDQYRSGSKSQVLYKSHILEQLVDAERNSGNYQKITVGSRLQFQNMDDQGAIFRVLK